MTEEFHSLQLSFIVFVVIVKRFHFYCTSSFVNRSSIILQDQMASTYLEYQLITHFALSHYVYKIPHQTLLYIFTQWHLTIQFCPHYLYFICIIINLHIILQHLQSNCCFLFYYYFYLYLIQRVGLFTFQYYSDKIIFDLKFLL